MPWKCKLCGAEQPDKVIDTYCPDCDDDYAEITAFFDRSPVHAAGPALFRVVDAVRAWIEAGRPLRPTALMPDSMSETFEEAVYRAVGEAEEK